MSPLILGALLILATWCGAQGTNRNFRDSWFNPPKSPDYFNYTEFKPQLFFRVRPVALAKSISELNFVRIKPLNDSDAIYLIGNAISIPRRTTPYLVRGLYINDGTGGFSLMRKGKDLWVHHSSLGSMNPMKRQPLVVFLSWKPRNVYTDASTAL